MLCVKEQECSIKVGRAPNPIAGVAVKSTAYNILTKKKNELQIN